MNLKAVRYFLAINAEGSFTRAAKRCGVSQPSLSNAITRLEKHLGGPLFHREAKRVSLSKLGRALLPHFKKLDQCVERARRDAAYLNSLLKEEIDRTNRTQPTQPTQATAYRRCSRAHHSNADVLREVDKVGSERGHADATVDSTQ